MGSPRFAFGAPTLLAIAFAGHLIDVLVLEPRLGFSSSDDFYDAGKFLAVIGHPVWKIGGFFHLLAAFSILILAREPTRQPAAVLARFATPVGVAAAVLFILVSLTNFVGLRELWVIANLDAADAEGIYGSFLVFRSVLLNGAILFLGCFLLLGNGVRLIPASENAIARYLGMAAGIACVLMPVAPSLAPAMILLVCGWGIASGILAFRR